MRIRRTLQALTLVWALAATACAGGNPTVATGSPATGTPASSPSTDPTGSPGTESPSAPAPQIEDGRHFVFVKSAMPGDPNTLRFDLAYFLTGDEANQAAQENGDEVPVPNDYYIVNDNPKLRTVPVADDAELLAYDWSTCCDEYTHLTFDEFAGYLDDPSANFHGKLSPYWIRVKGGEIVKIEEQFLP
jgi:hypothetical protein